MLEFSSTESCTTSTTSSPLVGFSSNTSSCDGNVALMNDFESTEGCSSQGPQGPEGFSAYQIAVFDGFVGTEEEWLASLVGPGVPVGGTAGQILSKINSTNYNTQWINSPSLTGFVPYIGATQALNLGAFSLTANSIIKNGGTSSQYLMADGTTSLGFVLPTLTTGSVLFSNGTTIAQNNANFFWNNANNRLGIGTTTPSYALHVSGVTGSNTFTIPSYNTQLNQNYLMLYGGYGAGMQGTYNNPTGGDLTFGTFINSIFNEKMRLLPSGNLGIGTATPISTLDVNGQVSIKNGLNFFKATTNIVGSYNADASNYQDLLIKANSYDFSIGAVNKLFISSAGNVGINTSTFVGSIKLAVNGQIGGPTYSSTYLDVTGAIPELRGNSGIGYYSSVGNHTFYGGSSVEYMRLTTAGLLGIGTNSPIGKLDVVGSLVTARVLTTGSLSLIGTDTSASAQTVFTISTGVNNATGPNIILAKARGQANEVLSTSDILGTIQFQGGNGTTLVESARIQSVAASGFSVSSRASSLLFYTTAIGSTTITERMRINSEGNVGIGTTAPQHLLTVSKANATTSYDANANRFINVVNTDITDQNISMIGLSGYDTTSTLRKGAFIGAIYHDRTATSVPTDLILGTSGNGAVEQLVTQMRITTQGTVLIGVSSNANNKLDISDTSLAGSGALAGSVLNIAQTWNTTGVPTALLLNVTDTASNGSSKLFDFQVGGLSQLMLFKDGRLNLKQGGAISTSGGNINLRTNLAGGSGYNLDVTSYNSFNTTSLAQGFMQLYGTLAYPLSSAVFKGINLFYTINNTGVQSGTATGIFLNATETALNGMVHNLMDLQVGGVSAFRVSKFGELFLGGYFKAAQSSSIGWAGTRSQMYSPSDGVITLNNNASTDFGRLQLGGTTNLFPAIKRNGAAIDFRLADDSGFCGISASLFTQGAGDFSTIISATNFSIYTGGGIITYNGNSKFTNGLAAGTQNLQSSAILQGDSTTKGFLPPRMTTAQKVGIAAPATGLVVFDTDLGKLCVFATTWQTITSV
jgi:hypothetical protein